MKSVRNETPVKSEGFFFLLHSSFFLPDEKVFFFSRSKKNGSLRIQVVSNKILWSGGSQNTTKRVSPPEFSESQKNEEGRMKKEKCSIELRTVFT
jgi:hypothetical protein